MKYTFTPRGVCSRQMTIEIENDTLTNVSISGGCNGNSKGIGALVKGMKVDDVIERLNGITCGYKPTSCPDQLAQALKSYKDGNLKEMQ